MTEPATKPRRGRAAARAEQEVSAFPSPSPQMMRYGDFTAEAKSLTEAELRRNLDLSAAALQGLKSALLKPGIRIRRKKDVPLFYSTDEEPDLFVRELNGKRERGIFENGSFKPID